VKPYTLSKYVTKYVSKNIQIILREITANNIEIKMLQAPNLTSFKHLETFPAKFERSSRLAAVAVTTLCE